MNKRFVAQNESQGYDCADPAQLAHIEQGLREADAGEFVPEDETDQILCALRGHSADRRPDSF